MFTSLNSETCCLQFYAFYYQLVSETFVLRFAANNQNSQKYLVANINHQMVSDQILHLYIFISRR